MNKAFTLIELSIVLVIIGLIVGGVLVGRDLIHSAKINKVISQKNEIERAALTFKLKYNALPGDMLNYNRFGFSWPTSNINNITTGDGNGVIGNCGVFSANCSDITSGVMEYSSFWSNLRSAGILKTEIRRTSSGGEYSYVDADLPMSDKGVWAVWYTFPFHISAGGGGIFGKHALTIVRSVGGVNQL